VEWVAESFEAFKAFLSPKFERALATVIFFLLDEVTLDNFVITELGKR